MAQLRHASSFMLIQIGILCLAQLQVQARHTSSVELIAPTGEQETTADTTASIVTMSTETMTTKKKPRPLDFARDFIKKNMASAGSDLTRKLLRAQLSLDCTLGLANFMRALQELEPWTMRLIDSSAKYPTGLLQGTFADVGAYDECIETVVKYEDGTEKVRGQFCNVYIQTGTNDSFFEELLPAMAISHGRMQNFTELFSDNRLGGIRLGICFISECTEEDLQKIIDTVLGSAANTKVRDCVTSSQEAIDETQTWIIALLATIAALIIFSTAFEVCSQKWGCKRKQGACYQALVAFSVINNTKIITAVSKDQNSETYNYRFIHGLRFLSIFWVVLGHSYGVIVDNMSRLSNALHYFDHWETLIVTAGYQAVDTFFFLSGFLLYYSLDKQTKNRVMVGAFTILKRFIRGTTPAFFVIMCIYLVPLIASGPTSKDFYRRYNTEIRDHWWGILLQVRNWQDDVLPVILTPLWYLSADFQLFVVSLIVIQILKTKKWLLVCTFAVLSLASCAITAWIIYGTHMLPFEVAVVKSLSVFMDTHNKSYVRPYYHAVCFFSGCITFVLTKKYARKTRIPKLLQGGFWCVALFCGLLCLFMRHEWYRKDDAPTETSRLLTTFSDRILWSVFISWLVFACATGRGGPLFRFLSWPGFIPVSRLSFGVYLVHYPIYIASFSIARERFFFSHYNLVSQCFSVFVWSNILSYFIFLACDAPTSHFMKLILMGEGSKRDRSAVTEDINKNTDILAKIRERKKVPHFLNGASDRSEPSGEHSDISCRF